MKIRGCARIEAAAAPAFNANSGMFTTITRNAAGDYTLTLDDNFAYDANVVFHVSPEAAVAASGLIGVGILRATATTVRITTGVEAAAGGASVLTDVNFAITAIDIRGITASGY